MDIEPNARAEVRKAAVAVRLEAIGGVMTETPSRTQILLARLTIVLLMALAAVSVVKYGLSEEVRHRVWEQLIQRPTGPMSFRFILQPIMAAVAALRDGIDDAK